MKIGILSDCHLGVSKFRKMYNLQNYFSHLNDSVFKEAFQILKDNEIEHLIISGDLFDSPNPSIFSIKTAQEEFLNFRGNIYVLGGNHDYSQKSMSIDCHAFDLINFDNVKVYYRSYEKIELDDVDIYMVPYKQITPENIEKLFKEKEKSTKKSILVIHGVIDLNSNNENDTEYSFPKEVIQKLNFDLIVCGHTHLQSEIRTRNFHILTPGSLMPSSQASENSPKPAVFIYNTNTKELEKIILKKSPNIINIITMNVNLTLEEIGNDSKYNDCIVSIKYTGKSQDIDEYLYKKAYLNCLNLSVQTNEQKENTNQSQKVSNFWDFISNKYPNFYDEFQQILKEEIQ